MLKSVYGFVPVIQTRSLSVLGSLMRSFFCRVGSVHIPAKQKKNVLLTFIPFAIGKKKCSVSLITMMMMMMMTSFDEKRHNMELLGVKAGKIDICNSSISVKLKTKLHAFFLFFFINVRKVGHSSSLTNLTIRN